MYFVCAFRFFIRILVFSRPLYAASVCTIFSTYSCPRRAHMYPSCADRIGARFNGIKYTIVNIINIILVLAGSRSSQLASRFPIGTNRPPQAARRLAGFRPGRNVPLSAGNNAVNSRGFFLVYHRKKRIFVAAINRVFFFGISALACVNSNGVFVCTKSCVRYFVVFRNTASLKLFFEHF